MKFQDLPVGKIFEFARGDVTCFPPGPWTKTSPGKYQHVDGGPEIRVGSTKVEIFPTTKDLYTYRAGGKRK